LLPKDLKLLRVAVSILSVFLVGCASTRQASTQSRISNVIEQPDIGVILSLADFHFDPLFDPKLFQALVQSAPSEWTRIFDGSQVSGYGQYGKDSNYKLLVSALQHAALAAPKADFILLAGDWLAHDLSETYYQHAGNRNPRGLYEFIDKTMAFLTQRIRDEFPDVPIYPALGNVDSYCGDYQLQPKGEFLRRTADTWKVFFHNRDNQRAFMETFPTGGYYAVSASGAPNHRIVVLNTVFFAPDYRNQCGNPKDDPAGDQLRWLAAELKDAAAKGDKVWLLYHIPPGIDAYNTVMATGGSTVEKVIPLWQAGHQESFLKLLNQYRSTILFTLTGHSHTDEFRLPPDLGTGRPATFLLVTPAISPIFENNPGLQVLSYDRRTFSLLDYTTHRLDLAAGPSTDWKEGYRFSRTYRLFPVTGGSLETLSWSLRKEAQTRATYMRHYNVGNTASPQITDQTWPVFWCVIGHLTVAAFQTCVENFSRP
jgi:sphingomyelin phosphodiesterase acid-like 3